MTVGVIAMGATATKSQARRIGEAACFWAVWVGLGLALHLRSTPYLLLGVPLTAAFQLGVRRRPLRELWVRAAPAFRADRRAALLTCALGLVPLYDLVGSIRKHAWQSVGWDGCAVVGAAVAAYALQHFRRQTWKDLLVCLAVAGSAGIAFVVLGALVQTFMLHHRAHPRALVGLKSLLVYFPVSFLLEEVSFRGLLDAHVQHLDDRFGIATAALVSVLWGCWHFPIVAHPAGPRGLLVLFPLALVHVATGVPLAIFWRRSGNLAVPAFAHAFIDAVRNALMAGL